MTITRYVMTRNQSGYRVYGNLVESPKGDYVKWSDVEPLLHDAAGLAISFCWCDNGIAPAPSQITEAEKIRDRLIAALSGTAK